MKHIRQEKNECSLAVCSMLSGAKYSDVQAYAEERYPFSIGKGYHPYQVNAIFTYHGLEYHTQSAHDAAPDKSLKTLKLHGQGYILYRPRNTGMWHVVAYQSGMVFDPDESRPYRLHKWVRDYASPKGPRNDFRVIQRTVRRK